MEQKGWLKADWGVSELGRRAKLYSLTARGRQQLKVETSQWAYFSAAVSRVLSVA
jgi:DNA-binding PadR family transcriptional regulator